jgi:UDP-N-acetyl-2-amino-2-deoxyglucuronate dehydrogenase
MVNFAIVGCGHIANKHAEAITNTEGANLWAVCDLVPEKMEEFKKKYNIHTYTNLEELLQNKELDVVNICTPSGFHAKIAIKAAAAGKHVIVEKPIALTVEDAALIIKTCKEHKVKLSVVHHNRFIPVMRELKKMMEDTRLGKLSHANCTVRLNRNQEYYDQSPWRGTRELDGGVLMNQAIHFLDLLIWLVGDVEQVFSLDATRLRNIEAEDVSVSVLKFVNGALGVVEAATTIYPKNLEESISIFGEKGSIVIGGVKSFQIKHIDIDGLGNGEKEKMVKWFADHPYDKPGHQWIVEDMVNAIKYNDTPAVTGEDGKKVLQFVTSLYQSAKENKPIFISREEV